MSKSVQVQQKRSVEQEIQLMYFYDDFNNVVGIANETQAVLEYFKNDPQHPMVNINLNRLIVQINLSNGVHMDQQEIDEGKQLQSIKKDLKQLYQNVMGKSDQYDERITKILKSYLKNLESVMELHQLGLMEMKEAEFNQKVVQKLVDGMSFMDNQVQKIKNGERYQKLTVQQIKYNNQKRKEQAFTKLSVNFPKANNQPFKSKDDNQNKKQLIQSPVNQLNQQYKKSDSKDYSNQKNRNNLDFNNEENKQSDTNKEKKTQNRTCCYCILF